MKWTPRPRRFPMVVVIVAAMALAWAVDPAMGIGFILGETKEQLKLKYDLAVTEVALPERGVVLVTIELAIADEGRLKPLDEVQLTVPSRQKNKDGSYGSDLVVSIDMKPAEGGKRVGRVQLVRELAERSELLLNTYTLDGKKDGSTRLHHVIPVVKYLKGVPTAAQERNKD